MAGEWCLSTGKDCSRLDSLSVVHVAVWMDSSALERQSTFFLVLRYMLCLAHLSCLAAAVRCTSIHVHNDWRNKSRYLSAFDVSPTVRVNRRDIKRKLRCTHDATALCDVLPCDLTAAQVTRRLIPALLIAAFSRLSGSTWTDVTSYQCLPTDDDWVCSSSLKCSRRRSVWLYTKPTAQLSQLPF